ncbi:MAG: hypothetical protein A3K06_03780 [Candidatus Doudnabacteria bacterium RIFCSPHIGHO2_01_52_17]|uniref:DUF8173 domain-containing protein n=1 Tax=Candidatus Doudnabacteria bacterium RIFCSPHIGHO2_01_52_17 TaxID=1817820 RepID=A0A1F5NDM6_9BACT|nr:MAG: hypothetical protein A3K06_03780 [Candidatus Doudnabacteria bacterium RIFCSPHIGHO2_01_52_17]
MRKWSSFLIVFAVLFVAQPVLAAEFIMPGKTGSTVVSDEGHHNVYTAGGAVTVTSNVTGDLVAAGGNVLVQGDVEEDLMAGGGTVIVNGKVGGDIRIGGGNVTITAAVGGDVLAGGGTITLANSAQVSGDLVLGGGAVLIDAPIAGDVRIGGGSVNINSRIGGDVIIEADQELVFGSKSVITGKIKYRGVKEAVIEEGAQISEIEFSKLARKGGAKGAVGGIAGAVVWTIGMIIAGLLLLKFFRRRVRTVVDRAFDRPWLNLGIGFLFAVALPVAGVILLITIVGVYAALILFAWLGLIYLVVSVIAAMFLGATILRWLKKSEGLRWTTLVLGAVLLMILKFIPFVGWLACLVIWLIAFGATLRTVKERIIEEEQSGL